MTKKLSVGLAFFAIALAAPDLEAQTAAKPSAETTRLIQSVQGADLYAAYCAVCHGKEGKGDGPMAKSLKARVPDLTGLSERNRGHFPFDKVVQIISGEDDRPAGHGPREMPVWGPIFSQIAWDQDLGKVRVYNLTKYLERIQSKPSGAARGK